MPEVRAENISFKEFFYAEIKLIHSSLININFLRCLFLIMYTQQVCYSVYIVCVHCLCIYPLIFNSLEYAFGSLCWHVMAGHWANNRDRRSKEGNGTGK